MPQLRGEAVAEVDEADADAPEDNDPLATKGVAQRADKRAQQDLEATVDRPQHRLRDGKLGGVRRQRQPLRHASRTARLPRPFPEHPAPTEPSPATPRERVKRPRLRRTTAAVRRHRELKSAGSAGQLCVSVKIHLAGLGSARNSMESAMPVCVPAAVQIRISRSTSRSTNSDSVLHSGQDYAVEAAGLRACVRACVRVRVHVCGV
jgi:hypothetical protein